MEGAGGPGEASSGRTARGGASRIWSSACRRRCRTASTASPFGSVLALTIVDPAERERFVFASDLQGPASAVAAAYLIQQRPTLLYLSGPVSYLEREVGRDSIERAIDHLVRVVEATGCRVIMDHHALRDARYAERFGRLWETGRVVTAAAYLGLDEAPLESRRNRAWAADAQAPGAGRGGAC